MRDARVLDLYLDEISRVPLLTRDEEMELARKAFRGNVAAQEKLARHNVRFVVSVAKKFQNRGVPLVDLIGEGNLGLMTAARKFDPDRGVKFISYAVWWIRQAVQAAIARHGRPVRVPLNRTADLSRLGRTTTLLKERAGPDADHRGAGPRHRAHGRGGAQPQRPQHRGGAARPPDARRRRRTSGSSGSPCAEQEGTDSATIANSQTSDIESALAVLPPRDAKVLRLYFGLDDGNSRTLEEIGRMMGVTRERIRQLRDRALLRLREGETGERLRDLVA